MRRLSGAAVALAVAACSGAAEDTPAVVLVGALEGTDGLVAVVRAGDTVTAYTCGGPTTITTHTGWFEAVAAGEQFTAQRSDGLVLSGAFTDAGATGTLKRPDGTTVAWTARPGTGPSGLWAGADGPCRTGAIVTLGPSGDPVAVGAWCDGKGAIGQVVPVHPIIETPNGLGVRLDFEAPTAAVTWLQRFALP